MQNSTAQFDEEQLMQIALKESIKELPPLINSPQQDQEDEEEMLRQALAMSS